MKIGVLSREPDSYSTRRLVEIGQARGHVVEVINPLECYINIAENQPSVHIENRILNDLDAIIPRIGASITFYGTAVLRQFEMAGVYCVNESLAISRARDKLRAHQLFSRRDIGMPVTGFAHSTGHTRELIDLVGGPPLVIKLLEGTQGRGVILAETHKAAESVIEAFRNLKAFFLVQEFIKEAGGADIRCFVVGNKVVAAMMRQAQKGDFRSNLHRGGSFQTVRISAEERKTALAAARVMGLRVAGVDLVRSNRGPLVLEVNSSPGLQGIETATGKEVAATIFQFIEKNVKPNQGRERGRG